MDTGIHGIKPFRKLVCVRDLLPWIPSLTYEPTSSLSGFFLELEMSISKKSGIYICLFSTGLVKVGMGASTSSRISQHKSTAKIFRAELIESKSFACKVPFEAERRLIEWCIKNSEEQVSREWFYGINFFDLKGKAFSISEENNEMYAERSKSDFRSGKSAESVLDKIVGDSRLIDFESIGGGRISNGLSLLLKELQLITRAARLESNDNYPEWLKQIDMCGPWEDELLCALVEGSAISDILRSLADAMQNRADEWVRSGGGNHE